MHDTREQADHALKQAQRAAKRGDLRESERWSKVAANMALAAEKLSASAPPAMSPQDEEAMRAELRARIRRLVDSQFELEEWQKEELDHRAAREAARAAGQPEPPPLRPCPGGQSYLDKIARGEA